MAVEPETGSHPAASCTLPATASTPVPLVCLPSSNKVWQIADSIADTRTDGSVYAKPVPAPKPALGARNRTHQK
jgi:hypothetical protein